MSNDLVVGDEELLSQSTETEQKILAFCVQNQKFISEVIATGVTASWFANDYHATYFETIRQYYNKYNTICPVSQMEFIVKRSTANVDVAHQIINYHRGLQNIQLDNDEFQPILEELVNRHKMRVVKKAIIDLGLESSTLPIDDAMARFASRVSVVNLKRTGGRFQLKDICQDARECVFNVVFDTYMNPQKNSGWDLGLPAMDENFLFKRGRMHLIAGMTGQGKTTLARNMAMRLVARHGIKVLILSCEESVNDYFSKMASSCLGIPLYRMERGTLNSEELELLNIWSENPNDIIAPNGGWLKVLELPSKEYSLQQAENIMVQNLESDMPDVIVIDQLNLLAPIWNRGDKVHMEHGDTTTYFRDMCKKYDIAGIILAQVGRSAIKSTKDSTRIVEINIENIEGSNKPGQDSDLALAVSSPPDEEGFMVVKCLKHRAGKSGWEVRLSFHKETGNISSAMSMSMGNVAESVPSHAVERELITMTDSSGNIVRLNPETSARDILDTEELPEAILPEDYESDD